MSHYKVKHRLPVSTEVINDTHIGMPEIATVYLHITVLDMFWFMIDVSHLIAFVLLFLASEVEI